MATINMNAVQFYDPSSTAPSLSARCAATIQKYRQSTGIPHRKQRNRVLESYSYASDGSIAADKDEFLPVDEVIRRALHLEDLTKKPTTALAAQGTNETSLLDGSGASMPAQSSLPGHLDGSKEQPVILNYDNNDDDDNRDNDSSSTSGGGISSDLGADGTGQELGPPPSLTTPFPGSTPSSSRDPSLHRSVAPHDQSPEGQAIQQDDGCIGREMSEQPSCPALILSDDEDDETEKGQQQEAGEDKEQEAYNSDTSSNGDIDNNNNRLQDNDESEGLQTTKQRRLSPCDPAIRRSGKRRLQHSDEGISTIRKEQKGHDSDGISGSSSGSDNDHRDGQDSDDSEGPRPAKRRRASPSSSDPRSQKQRLQRPHNRCLISPSKRARADPGPFRKETQQPSPLVSNNSGGEDSEVAQLTKRRRPSPSNSDPTSKRSQWQRRSNMAPPQTQLDLSVNSDDCAQSQHSSTHSKDDEQMPTTAEYREWPMYGFFKRTTIGNKTHYSMDFSLEQLQELCAVACPLHATSPISNRYFPAGKVNLPKVGTRVKKTRSSPPSRSKRTPFTSKENAMLLDLKENKGWPWKRIEPKFPQRTLNSLQVHYCTKLKGKVLTEGDE